MKRSFRDHHSDIYFVVEPFHILEIPIEPVAVGKIWQVRRVLPLLLVYVLLSQSGQYIRHAPEAPGTRQIDDFPDLACVARSVFLRFIADRLLTSF